MTPSMFAWEQVMELIRLYGYKYLDIIEYAYQSVVYDTERNMYPQNEMSHKMNENSKQYASIALGTTNSRDDHYISKGILVHI